MKWEVISKNRVKSQKELIDILLKNRGIVNKKDRESFFEPKIPEKLTLKELGISESEVKKAIVRIKKAIKTQEKVFVYGDYDADGVCATAIMWETLFSIGLNVLPYIPERFSEGYGLNVESIKKLKEENVDLGLIITVDHGIVADKKIDTAKELGIDVVITDHHQPGKAKPKPFALVHTTKISGSGVSYIFANEIKKKIDVVKKLDRDSLELAAIGTIADQLPLIGPNRSIAKYGLDALNKTKRVGLITLFENAAVKIGNIGTYEVGFMIAPRINAMGRLGHAIESLR
ncbi:MAG: DHH family phosphoesterase, partial [Microgenomates group bacterium]